ncbi:hypothetical protein [Nocardioides sp. Arc9.136]|uniref:hypothetical protein n=1 Tax=Nocardioides sp. Arc9.136 TaxID=2996826 RepID=UPI0026659FC0|nr:hypothetical protein [Nocardioides sp. Arc9.136]WKN49333.1 hypothetical protein OSR43_04195 [Nocardioides sp. Arc9.136]
MTTVPDLTKLMFLVRGEDAPLAELLEDGLRGQLAAAGASRLQVNLDDEPVAAALRIPGPAAPVRAVVSVWAAGGTAAVVDVLAAAVAGATLDGWEVEERLPLAPPEVADGRRAEALANVAVLRRPAELDVDEWRHRWLVDHTPVAIETQGTFGYVQNLVLRPVTEDATYVSAIVEELFPMAAVGDLHAFYGSGGDADELRSRMERMMASVGRFGADRDLDLVPTSRYGWSL